jgi:Protein of unknown function (DUF1493)
VTIAVDAIEERVFLFVARERATKRAKLSLSCRLNQDLGMDGDDAVEFFEKFQREFRVDLCELTLRWSEYFGPEGVSPWAAVMGSGGIVGCVALGTVLERYLGFLRPWAWDLISLVCGFGPAFYWLSKRNSRLPAITIGDLIEAAHAGKWLPPVEQNGEAPRRL